MRVVLPCSGSVFPCKFDSFWTPLLPSLGQAPLPWVAPNLTGRRHVATEKPSLMAIICHHTLKCDFTSPKTNMSPEITIFGRQFFPFSNGPLSGDIRYVFFGVGTFWYGKIQFQIDINCITASCERMVVQSYHCTREKSSSSPLPYITTFKHSSMKGIARGGCANCYHSD